MFIPSKLSVQRRTHCEQLADPKVVRLKRGRMYEPTIVRIVHNKKRPIEVVDYNNRCALSIIGGAPVQTKMAFVQ